MTQGKGDDLRMNHLAERVHQLEGLTVHTVKTNKYKTNTIILMIKAPLKSDTVSFRALLPQLFQNGTVKSPSRTLLRERLDDMYGATFTTDVQKKGEDHVITLRMDVANEQFLTDGEPLFHRALALLAEIVFQPYIEDGVFPSSAVNNEKRSLIQRIQAVYDDKMRYANMRITEEMCKGEPYALTAFGTIEAVEAISPKSLYQYYEDVLASNQFNLYIVGALEEELMLSETKAVFTSLLTKHQPTIQRKTESRDVAEEKVVHEVQNIKQGKLHIGFRTYTTFADDDYVALQVYNGLFGGFSHSKLFINVREKESLAYYASSQLESHKGIMMVMSGIEFNKYERALAIIKEQFEAMKRGDFTEDELKQTKAMVRNQILEIADVARGLVELSYHQVVSGHARTLSEWIQQVEAVTKEDIIRVANKVRLDTIYFLKGQVENE